MSFRGKGIFMWVSRADEAKALAEQESPIPRAATKVSFHLRRYMPLYAFATVWVAIAVLVPTVNHNNSQSSALTGTGSSASSDLGGPSAAGVTSSGGGGSSAATTSSSGGGSSATSSNPTGGPVAAVQRGGGTTRLGNACRPGVSQIPFSHYAAPCVAKFTGNNGGATATGVTGSTIKIALRIYSDQNGANAKAVEQVNEQAGNPSNAQYEQIRNTYLKWFNSNFELYGRHVEIVPFNGQGNSTDEALGNGQAAACADADAIATTVKAFGVITYPAWSYDSIPFSECAARYHLWSPLGGAYYPEQTWYKTLHPYVWGIIPDCELVEHLIAEYIGKRLANKPAQWAGDALTKRMKRAFGIYIPQNAGYQHCVGISNADLQGKYHVKRASQYNYKLDVSQFAQQAAQAMVQFKAAHVTTVELACDPISAIFLTQQADAQQFHPEWLLHGDALTDTDGYARLYQGDQVNGHLYGISQLGAQNIAGSASGEAAQAWKQATKGQALPNGGWQVYYEMLEGFDQLQSAGPVLTVANIGKGTAAMGRLGGENLPQGVWDLTKTHTAIKTTQEVFWDSKRRATDGKTGDFVATYSGRWFELGEFPTGTPPIHPE